MLTFLRKIRKSLIDSGSVRKYLLYALGEIVLVVVGILIALQINNWNEGRKKSILLQKTLEQIATDFESDLPKVRQTIQRVNWRVSMIDSVVSNLIPEDRLYNCFECLLAHTFTDEFVHSNNGYRILQTLEVPDATSEPLLQEIFSFYKTYEESDFMISSQRLKEDSYKTVELIRDRFPNVDGLGDFFEMAETMSIQPEIGQDLLAIEGYKRRMIFHRSMLSINTIRHLKFYEEKSSELMRQIRERK